jgi:cytoskeletal protein RodZ
MRHELKDELMEKQDFGSFLRDARERRRLSMTEISAATKVSESSLRRLESGELDALPADIFVRGFIRSYAKSVGIPEAEPLGLYEQAVATRNRAREAMLTTPTSASASTSVATATLAGESAEEDGLVPKRGIGLAVFVIIVLLIATITLSLFLRQPPQAGEGLSWQDADWVSETAPVGKG